MGLSRVRGSAMATGPPLPRQLAARILLSRLAAPVTDQELAGVLGASPRLLVRVQRQFLQLSFPLRCHCCRILRQPLPPRDS